MFKKNRKGYVGKSMPQQKNELTIKELQLQNQQMEKDFNLLKNAYMATCKNLDHKNRESRFLSNHLARVKLERQETLEKLVDEQNKVATLKGKLGQLHKKYNRLVSRGLFARIINKTNYE